MPHTFTLNDNVSASFAASQLYAATPVYRLTAQAQLVSDLTGITPENSSIRVRVPDIGSSSILAPGGTTTATDLTEGSVTLDMSTGHFYDLKSYSAVESAYRVARTVQGAVVQAFGGSIHKIAEDIEARILKRARTIPYWVGSPGTAIDTLAKANAGVPVIVKNRGWTGAPVAVFSPDDYNTVSTISEFAKANERGAATTVATGEIGNVWGITWVSSRAVDQPTDNHNNYHTAGTLQAGSPLVNGVVAAGATTMNVDGGVGTEPLKVGDLFSVAGAAGTNQFVVVENTSSGDYTAATETYTASGGAITALGFYPAAPTGGFADNAAITVLASHTKNYLFTPGCLAAAVIPPLNIATLTGQPGSMQSVLDPVSGIGLALTLYDRSSSTLGTEISIDTFGEAVLVSAERGAVYVS